ncbi:MAG: YlxR family protein [Chloroflexi bacterium]|nr:YlxR family protein [Chloroflexota bacterium]MCL5075417.1 YlxR family protein [Chloroflexota bacterium]
MSLPLKAVKRPKGSRPKHIPQRTCVACQQVRPKRELVRVVRTPTGRIEVDPTGKRSGRGAYLCRARSCWELSWKKRSLEYVLQTKINPEDRAQLEQFVSTLPEEEPLSGGLEGGIG